MPDRDRIAPLSFSDCCNRGMLVGMQLQPQAASQTRESTVVRKPSTGKLTGWKDSHFFNTH